MGAKWRDDTMTKNQTTLGEGICLTLLVVVTIAWLLFTGVHGQDTKQDRLHDSGTIPPTVCTDPSEVCP